MKKIIGLSILALTASMFSCNTDKVETFSTDEVLSEKSANIALNEAQIEATTVEATYEVEFFANAEETLTRWWKIGKRFGWRNQHKARYVRQCPEVLITQGENDGYPKNITLNYGDSTMLLNGKVLSGTIEVLITAPKKSKDYSRMISYTNFGMDSALLNGTSTVEVDKVDDMFRKYTSSLSFTLSDGTEITRQSERIWQWLAGIDTEENQSDDVITITGKAEAQMNGETYKKEITTPLKRIGDCKYIVEGIVEITLNGELICTMNYGDGTCDEFAEMTNADGKSTVDLTKRKANRKQDQNSAQGNE